MDWSGLDKTPFLKLLVVRCLRPDRLNMATENWVRGNFPDGHKYVKRRKERKRGRGEEGKREKEKKRERRRESRWV